MDPGALVHKATTTWLAYPNLPPPPPAHTRRVIYRYNDGNELSYVEGLSVEDHTKLLIDAFPSLQEHFSHPTYDHEHTIQRVPKCSDQDAGISRKRELSAGVAG